ncbi:Rft-1-domain-containing protein [Violaceomyces palustris]|uniref:Rft-1-domain-containing protein n=1 Tax=Violaceomyces palustris TaxID=1673888 RepID=A0ACD0NV78_9BASI|nr:Rft-1-domain-containing protein [Violaceomyces palustris]
MSVRVERPPPTPNLLSSATSLILLQLSSRFLTFFLNQFLLTLTSPSTLGAANIQLDLLLSTILFVSRESIRSSLIRNPHFASEESCEEKDRRKVDELHNLSTLPLTRGIAVSLLLAPIYVKYLSAPSLRETDSFNLSVSLYVLGACLELFSEPLYLRSQAANDVSTRVKAEGFSVLFKCLSTLAAVLTLPRLLESRKSFQTEEEFEKSLGLLAFGLGQTFYGLTTLFIYSRRFFLRYGLRETLKFYRSRKTVRDYQGDDHRVKGKVDGLGVSKVNYDVEAKSLSDAMLLQSILKHCLTESDKLAVAKFSSLEDQGGYALASNYGSLVARMIFQPLEETSRLIFSKSLSGLTGRSEPKSPVDPHGDGKRGKGSPPPNSRQASDREISKTSQDGDMDTLVGQKGVGTATFKRSLDILESTSNLLSTLLRSQILLGLFFVTFGPPLSLPFLYALAGPRWSLKTSAPSTLGTYCYYLPVMGLNGLTEAFFESSAREKDLGRYKKVLILASLFFVGVLWLLNSRLSQHFLSESRIVTLFPGKDSQSVGGGEDRLVLSNTLSISIRAIYCWDFILKYFRSQIENLSSSIPSEGKGRSEGEEEMRIKLGRAKDSVEGVSPFSVIPSKPVLTLFVTSFLVMRWSETNLLPAKEVLSGYGRIQALKSMSNHFGIGVSCGLICLTGCFFFERKALMGAMVSIRRRKA